MNKTSFMQTLYSNLSGIPENEKNEIMYDYEEHFRMAKEQGRTEEDTVNSMGDPVQIARQFRAGYTVNVANSNKTSGNLLRAVFATCALGFFNLCFVIGPFFGVVGVFIGLYATAIALTFSGIAAFIAPLLQPFISGLVNIGNVGYPLNAIGSLTVSAAGVGLTCLGLLFFLLNIWLTKGFYKLTVKYLKWNIDFISRKNQ